ncbi:MAG: SMI1/KNR4 family protein, partial [Actinomycetota bacterium]|nr:SMI1/KNR4 family protein [Actinomycetota bacterium]
MCTVLPDEHVRAALSAAVTVEEVMRTICAKLGRLLAHHEALEGEPVGTLGKPVVDADLDAAEAVMGRLLPEDARALYLCRNGSMGFSPDVEFRTLETALKIWRIGYGGLELPILSNAPGWVEPEV